MGRHQGDVTMELHLNDILELKKDHPCGSRRLPVSQCFTVTLDEAVEVMRAEKKSGKLLSIGFQPRMDENLKMIKRIVPKEE